MVNHKNRAIFTGFVNHGGESIAREKSDLEWVVKVELEEHIKQCKQIAVRTIRGYKQ
jgi:hypothetical protein